MAGVQTAASRTVNTVLGPVPADDLGVVAVHEALLSVVPGAEHAYDIPIDRAEIFEILAGKLTAFRDAGGQTIVDSTGMFHGRDVRLYEALSRSTGVHIVASTGMGPEENLGGYFLTPQTEPADPVAGGEVRRPLRPGGHRGHGGPPRRAPGRRRPGGHRRRPARA